MLPTIIIGILFVAYIAWAFNKSRKAIKNNGCPGCSGGCSVKQKQACGSDKNTLHIN